MKINDFDCFYETQENFYMVNLTQSCTLITPGDYKNDSKALTDAKAKTS